MNGWSPVRWWLTTAAKVPACAFLGFLAGLCVVYCLVKSGRYSGDASVVTSVMIIGAALGALWGVWEAAGTTDE